MDVSKINLSDIKEEVVLWDGNLIFKKTKPVKNENWQKYPREKLVNFPPNTGTYKITDPASPVAVCVPRQDMELQELCLQAGAGIVGPVVTPNHGIELMVCNIVANPNLRYLILAGEDSGHLSGDAINAVSENGINWETGMIIGTKSPTSPFLKNFARWAEKGRQILERFRNQIQVINLLGCTDKKAIEFAIRACIQEPENPFIMKNLKTNLEYLLYDKGMFEEEPLIVNFKETSKKAGAFEGLDRVGTTIHSNSVSEAWNMLWTYILEHGIYCQFDSTVKGVDTISTQVVIHDLNDNLIPESYSPFEGLTKEQVKDYVNKYSTWVYLFPHSDVKYDDKLKEFVVYFPEKFDYVYGSRLCAYGWERLNKEEQEEISNFVKKFHKKYYNTVPDFTAVEEFHKELQELKPYKEKKVVDSIYKISESLKICIKENIQSYRLYMSLQDPFIDLSTDPRKTHAPCFCLYEVFPRKVHGQWQLDTVLLLRAHAYMAFPGNANGGIKINKYLSYVAGIKPGKYIHHSGCAQIYDFLLSKEELEKKEKEAFK